MSISPITVILLRRTKKDDVIHIRPHAEKENLLQVSYTDQSSGHSFYFEDTWDNVADYLAQIFAVLPLDKDPYRGVQFNLPAYPTVLISPRNTTDIDVMNPIWSMIQSVVSGWPVTVRGPASCCPEL